jgi:hypothetical protein
MKTLFAVTRTRGRAWDATKPMRSQAQWPEHAAFMDQLPADGFVPLGGPIGDVGDVVLIINARNQGEIHDTLSRDPWSHSGLLNTRQIQRWTVLLESNHCSAALERINSGYALADNQGVNVVRALVGLH